MFETSITVYQSTVCNIPEDSNLLHRCERLDSVFNICLTHLSTWCNISKLDITLYFVLLYALDAIVWVPVIKGRSCCAKMTEPGHLDDCSSTTYPYPGIYLTCIVIISSPSRLTLRLLISYIYGAPTLDVSRSHTTTHHSR